MTTTRPERRLSGIMAADIVGYSRLIESDEAATLAAITALRVQVIDSLLAEYKGRVVKMMGDGAIVEFGSVVDAVLCAVAMQKQVAISQREIASERRIIFRIGINLGDVVVAGDDLLGDGVNVAARLEQLSPPGGVLVSGTAYDQLRGKLDLPLDFAGEQRVKNISQPVRTYSVRIEGARRVWRLRTRHLRRYLPLALALIALAIAAGAAAWWFLPSEPESVRPSIAVLPFDNLGGDEATGRLADGLTEDIITDLSRFRMIDVIARNSTEVYKGKPVDARRIGKDLNVRYVLEGSIQRQGNQIRATAQLIDTATEAHVWSERWDRPAEDVFAVQTEIAEKIYTQLLEGYGPLQSIDLSAARRKRPHDLTAYDLNLLGNEKMIAPTRESLDELIRLLTRAVEIDPEFARAWINLSWAHAASGSFGADWEASSRAALAAAERAVELDPNDAEAHSVLGTQLGMSGEFERVKSEFDISLRLNPGSFHILTYYVAWASTFGEAERGAELADRAIRINPNYKPWAVTFFAFAYFMTGRYEDALQAMERLKPDNYGWIDWIYRAGSYAALERTAEARAAVAEALVRYPDITIERAANLPGFSEAEKRRLFETMRAAGFPLCAKPDDLARIADPVRLPECETAPAVAN